MTGEHRGPRAKGRDGWVGNWRRKGKYIHRSTIGANVVLIGSELSTLGGDTLQILLSRGIRVANLEEKTLFANGLAMEFLDDLLADISGLKSNEMSVHVSSCESLNLTWQSQHHDCCSDGHAEFCSTEQCSP